jgi:hypothetical protein
MRCWVCVLSMSGRANTLISIERKRIPLALGAIFFLGIDAAMKQAQFLKGSLKKQLLISIWTLLVLVWYFRRFLPVFGPILSRISWQIWQ